MFYKGCSVIPAYAIKACHNSRCEFNRLPMWGVVDTIWCDKGFN